jgi:hypothetical protein
MRSKRFRLAEERSNDGKPNKMVSLLGFIRLI